MTARGTLAVRHILKPKPKSTWPPSISNARWRNPHPLSSSSHDTSRFRVASSYHHKPLLLRPCSFHHRPPVSASDMSSEKPVDHYRLPTDLLPRHYALTIRTDLVKEKFTGFVKIDLDVRKATKVVAFNAAAELKLGPASLVLDSSASVFTPTETNFDAATQRASLTFAEELPAGAKVTLYIGFETQLKDSMTGYYKSTWDKGIYALTQFEPTDARRALPCWDEPLYKATFSVTLISRKDTVSLSNMPERADVAVANEHTEALFEGVKDGSWYATTFETTPPMSTYLLAFANGEFVHLESSYKSPLSGKVRPLRIYATPDAIGQAQYALDIKEKALPLYEQAFDIEYPLPKLDTLVANDFDAGAMENWGLITGRTTAYLVDPENADIAAKKRIAGTQSHEVAHMWFGNITTMKWWDNLYLNEGFATLMGEKIILDKIHPEWKVDADFINTHLSAALRLDAKLSSHPIEVEVPDAGQIGQIFDALSYSKAASVLRMLSKYVGEEKFLKGVSLYLKKHLYSNTVSRNLWEGIGEETGLDIPKIMDIWVSKMGFPVITVTETPTGIKVRQDRFLEDGPAKPEDNETIWSVPLGLVTASSSGQAIVDNSAILETREAEFKLDTSKPFKINADANGVYRVLYTPARLAAIAKEAAKPDSIFSLNDRIGLVHDAFALAKSGHLSLSAALNLVHELRSESEFLVWDSIGANLAGITHTWWEDDKVTQRLKAFRRALCGPLVQKLGLDYSKSDSADITQLRTLAVGGAAIAEDPATIDVLLDRFAKYIAGDTSAIPVDLLLITFCTAVKHNGAPAYDAVLKFFENPQTPSIKVAAIYGLTSPTDPALLARTFELLLSSVRNQDLISFFRGLATNPKAIIALRDFFEKNYDLIYNRLEMTFSFSSIVQSVYTGFAKEEDRTKAEAFFKDKDIRKYNQALAQALDGINAKAAFVKRSTVDVLTWLEKWENVPRATL
ncbi:leucyl aminopeptidase [Multifurca ochricompacta]|uniref:Aminopeptidase n=1 Tax=Multifurca ochricompacta TaxID=376703 RepID=A0AAD4LYR4_9AGAM|nr:leucyl aminopeptidase [Multifurca ochricompacta]